MRLDRGWMVAPATHFCRVVLGVYNTTNDWSVVMFCIYRHCCLKHSAHYSA